MSECFKNIIASSILYLIFAFIGKKIFDNSIYAFVFFSSLWWSMFGYKYFQYWVLKHKNYEANFCVKYRLTPCIEYNNFKVLSKKAKSITFDPWFFGVFCMSIIAIFCSIFIDHTMPNFLYLILYLFLGCFGLIFHIKDVSNFFKILTKGDSHLYVEFRNQNVIFSNDTKINYKYKDILFYKEIYKDMSLDDLKNELIMINQQIDDEGKFNFFTLCLIPGVLAIVGGIFSVISTMLAYDLDNSQDVNGTIAAYISAIIVIILVIFTLLFLVNSIFIPEKKNLLMQKTIIEEFIERSN